MSLQKPVVQIEGDLAAVDDDDSDSSDEEDDEVLEQAESIEKEDGEVRQPIRAARNDDDEEELEVFQAQEPVLVKSPLTVVSKGALDSPKGASPPVGLTPDTVKKGKATTTPGTTRGSSKKSLVSLMEASVDEVLKRQEENNNDNDDEPAPFNAPTNLTTQQPQVTAPAAQQPTPGKPDLFGIAYKPYKKKTEEYNIPSGPAFADEVEFEKELSESFTAKATLTVSAADDEFDFDGDDDKSNSATGTATVVAGQPSSSSSSAIQRALESAAERVRREAEEEAIAALAEQQREASLLAFEQTRNTTGTLVGNGIADEELLLAGGGSAAAAAVAEEKNKEDKKSRIMQAAKQALDDVMNVYGSGLGDLSLRAMEADTTSSLSAPSINAGKKAGSSSGSAGTTLSGKLTMQSSRVVDTIDEGDEEEAEREETEEELAAARLAVELLEQQSALEQEWSTLEAAPNPPPIAATTSRVRTSSAPAASSDSVFHSSLPSVQVDPTSGNVVTMSYSDAFGYLRSLDLSAYNSSIITKDEANNKSWTGIFSSSAPTPLISELEGELSFPFLLAQLDWNPAVAEHLTIMRSIFSALTGSTATSCPATGPHWERIGFQGLDPRTDVNRAMKMLAVLQALYLIEIKPKLAQKLYGVASLTPCSKTKGKDLSWPFMCVSIMFTKEALQALRNGVLNRDCNKERDVLSVVHEYHQACFLDFAKRIIKEPLVHHAVHLQAVRDLSASKPQILLKSYRTSSEIDYVIITPLNLSAPTTKGKLSVPSAPIDTSSDAGFADLDSMAENNSSAADDTGSSGGGGSRSSAGGLWQSLTGNKNRYKASS